MHRMRIGDVDAANYGPNSISENWPREIPPQEKAGGFATLSTERRGRQNTAAQPVFCGLLFPTAPFLAEPDAGRAGSYHRRFQL